MLRNLKKTWSTYSNFFFSGLRLIWCNLVHFFKIRVFRINFFFIFRRKMFLRIYWYRWRSSDRKKNYLNSFFKFSKKRRKWLKSISGDFLSDLSHVTYRSWFVSTFYVRIWNKKKSRKICPKKKSSKNGSKIFFSTKKTRFLKNCETMCRRAYIF